MADLSSAERGLLQWLSTSEYSQYGECYGSALDSLIARGYAQVHAPGEHQSGFIAHGMGQMYSAVSLTDAGRALAKGCNDG